MLVRAFFAIIFYCAVQFSLPTLAHDYSGAKEQAIGIYPVPEQEKKAFSQVPEAPRMRRRRDQPLSFQY
jgi:hypothetical protein